MKNPFTSLLANRRPSAAAGRASAGTFDGTDTSATDRKGTSVTRLAKAMSAFNFGRSDDLAGRAASPLACRSGLVGTNKGGGAPSSLPVGIVPLTLAAIWFVLLLLPVGAHAADRAKIKEIPAVAGSTGGAQLFNPDAIASNLSGAGGVTAGDFYVADRGNNRVVEYSDAGSFVRTFGLGVNQTTGGNICTAVSDDTCKEGTASTIAGSVTTPLGIAVDQATGHVYVYGDANRRVDVFSATGQFEGAFGWKVKAGAEAAEALQFCTAAGTGCQAATSTSKAGGILSQGENRTLAVDPVSAEIYVPDPGNARLNVYAPVFNATSEITDVSFSHSVGWDVIPSGSGADTGAGLETCTELTSCQAGTVGNGAGQFLQNNPISVGVDTDGFRYVVNARSGQLCTAALPCRVQKFNPDNTYKEDFGPASGPCQLTYANGLSASNQAAIAITVDPSTNHVVVLKKTSSTTYRVCEFDSAGNELDISPAGELTGALSFRQGIAVGPEDRIYVTNAGPAVYILAPVPAPEVEILPVTEIGHDTARLNGIVTVPAPGGEGFETSYRFEVSADNGFNWTRSPASNLSAGATAGPVSVSVVANGLQPNASYLVRLVAATGPSAVSSSQQFTTMSAAPTVSYVLGANSATDVVDPFGHTTAKLAGYVNPNNQLTTYRFEYGLTTAYGMQSPAEFEPSAGSGGVPLLVKAHLGGLQPNSIYHYRIVASNASGVTTGPDQQFETSEALQLLNSCGLPDGRCLEMVSPADKGAVGTVGAAAAGEDLRAQPATEGDAIAYQIANGLTDASAPNEVLYGSTRSESRWLTTQWSPPLSEVTEVLRGLAVTGYTRGLSPDLSCGVVGSVIPLTADTPARVIEAGGGNLYRRDNLTGAYRIITELPPVNAPLPAGTMTVSAGSQEYDVIGISDDCERVVFATPYKYAGVEGLVEAGTVGRRALYEWDGEELHGVGLVPSPTGEVEALVSAGAPGYTNAGENIQNAMSVDGDKVFFSAISQLGPDVGKAAVFARVGRASTINVSQSETVVPTAGARFQGASTDGRKVFFTANYGLSDATSSGLTNVDCANSNLQFGSCDLYEYDFNAPSGERLVDLSPHTAEEQGAAVAGVVAISDDGEYVYFAARGQLVPGKGRTFSQNQSEETHSIYLAHQGSMAYVGTVTDEDLTLGGNAVLMAAGRRWAAHATPDGRYLLFGSSANVTGFAPGGTVQAYRYAADSDTTVCVSCRKDGLSPQSADLRPLPSLLDVSSSKSGLEPLRALTSDGDQAFFLSRDSLVSGAREGDVNLYEWRRGQVYLLATAENLRYYGFSEDGDSVYFSTPAQLTWEDRDGRSDLYVARVGGGFDPPVTPAPCNPSLEGSCGGGASDTPAVVQPMSSIFSGPGNPDLSIRPRCSRRQVHRGNRCVAKRALARRACAKRKGKARQRCIRNQVRRLSTVQQRQQQRRANNDGRTGQ